MSGTVARLPAPPTDCSAKLEYLAGGVTLSFPPLGWKAARPFLLIAGFWNAIQIPFWTGFYYHLYTYGVETFIREFCDPPTYLWLLFPLPFLIIGLLSLWLPYGLARRRAKLTADAEKLRIHSVGVWRTKRGEWPRTEVADVRAVASCIQEEDDKPVLELQVCLKDGSRFGLLAGRGDAELTWAAEVLKRALQFPPRSGCYKCDQTQVQSCVLCDKLFCGQHGGERWIEFDTTGGYGLAHTLTKRVICDDCTPDPATIKRRMAFLVIFSIVVLGIMLFAFASVF